MYAKTPFSQNGTDAGLDQIPGADLTREGSYP